VGKEVIFGIRPEDTHDTEYVPAGIKKAEVEARVDVTELMGAEVTVYLVTDNADFIGTFDPRTSARVGNTVRVAFNMDHMHIFDKQTEMAIR
jgi:multiple sugar transport system ATP-binding protein